ncbi:MAG: histidine kinase [Bacteroidales bacterium]
MIANVIRAQFPFQKHYTVSDGLPSSRIYDLYTGERGFVWFATESGISRFDGYDFVNWGIAEGLPSGSVIRLFGDPKGRLWFLTYEGDVGYISDGRISIHPVSHADSLNGQFYDCIYVDSLDHIWLSGFNTGLLRISEEGIDLIDGTVGDDVNDSDNLQLFFLSDVNGFIARLYGNNKKINALLDFEGVRRIFLPSSRFRSMNSHKHLCYTDNNKLFLSNGNQLFSVEDGIAQPVRKFRREIIGIWSDTRNNLWVSVNQEGLYLYKNGSTDPTPVRIMEDYSVSAIEEDFEGSYWISTTDQGVFNIPSFQFTSFNRKALNMEGVVMYAVAAHGPYVYYSTGKNQVKRIFRKNGEFVNDPSFRLEGSVNSNVYSLLITRNNELWVPSTGYLRFTAEGKRLQVQSSNQHYGYKIIQLFNGNILLGTIDGFYEFAGNKLKGHSGALYGFYLKSFEFCQSFDSTVWIGTIEGLYTLRNNRVTPYAPNSVVLGKRISALDSYDSIVAVGTFDHGLGLIQGSRIEYYGVLNGLTTNRIKALRFQGPDRLWIGTNMGLTEAVIDTETLEIKRFRSFTMWDGLPSNEINDIEIDGEDVILATDNGLVCFNPANLISSESKPEVKITGLRVNELPVGVPSGIPEFDFDENNVEIDFRMVSFKDPTKTLYMYQLEGYENEWYETRNNSVRYPKLKAGSFRFLVRVRNRSGVWSEPASVSFKVKKHFTQYAAFRIGFGLLLLLVAGSIIWLAMVTMRNREELKRQAILAEQKAMRSQMNPHFIFNSLNSIQNFIIERDDKNANLYLVIFSSLIRRILEASKHNFISLREELETIKLYLELEKFRFEKHLDYQITVDPNLQLDQTSIPSMLLQPFLENAIWHGIVPKQVRGLLQVIFTKVSDDRMVIEIIDDGIGRVRAAEISRRRKHHKPTGMKNVEERLALLNKLNGTNMEVEVIDMYDDKNQATGTKVVFHIDI